MPLAFPFLFQKINCFFSILPFLSQVYERTRLVRISDACLAQTSPAGCFFFLTALADAGREVPVVQGRGMAQGGAVVLQRHDQPGRRGAGRADRQGPAPDRVQPVLRIVRAREPGAAQAGAAGLRPVEQGGRLLSGVQHAGRAHTASDGEERVRRPKGLGVVVRAQPSARFVMSAVAPYTGIAKIFIFTFYMSFLYVTTLGGRHFGVFFCRDVRGFEQAIMEIHRVTYQ